MPRLYQHWILVASVALVLDTRAARAQPDPGVLHAGSQLERRLAGSAEETLRISIPAGFFVRIQVLQRGADLVATLRDPAGHVLLQADSSNAKFGPETVVAVADSAGEYRLEVKNPGPLAASYAAKVIELRGATVSDAQVVAAHRNYAEGELLRGQRKPEMRKTALESLTKARDFFRSSGDRYMYGLGTVSLGAALVDDGRFAEALALYDDAAALFRDIKDPHMEAMALTNAGGALAVLGEPQKALQSYRRALAIGGDDDRAAQANLLNNIALTERSLGNTQAAIADYQQALRLVQPAGDLRTQGTILSNMGVAYRELGEPDRSIELFEQALPFRRNAGDKRGTAFTLLAMSESRRWTHQPEKALQSIEEATLVVKAIGDRQLLANALELRARALIDLRRTADARQSLMEALDLARAVQDRRQTALVLLSLGRASLLSGDTGKSADWTAQAAAEFHKIDDRSSEGIALEIEARAESARGNMMMARALIEDALRLDEQARRGADSEQLRASFFATRQDAYGFYIDLLMRSGAEHQALAANERARARSLVEMLAGAGSAVRSGVDPALLDRERDISDRLNAKGARLLPIAGSADPRATALTAEIRQLEADYEDVEAEIRRSSPRYGALTQPTLLTAEQIQADLLDANTLLLEYSFGEERSYLWVVSKDQVRSFTLPARARIEEQVTKVLRLVSTRSTSGTAEALNQLSALVLNEAAPLLAYKRLVIVPDGALQGLPFAMLPDANSREPLLVRHEIVIAPSASAIAALRTEITGRKPAPRLLAVFADPVFGPDDPRAGGHGTTATDTSSRILEHAVTDEPAASAHLKIPRLPYTAQEADAILNVARASSNLRAVGFKANREAATSPQLSDFRYLHFATHGYLDTERPSLSALVLAQIDAKGRPQDGFLRVNDIYNERLSADLAVLSACQTGLGKEVRGEGLMGLTRAFLYAGVPRVIVSMWNVNDRATAELMASLYKRILREDKNPAAALREAQLELRKNKRWESPFYWAAFVQHGEWQ